MLELDGVLGETDKDIELNGFEDNHAAVVSLLKQAHNELLFFSYDLQARIVDHEDVIDALSQFLRRHSTSHAKILISDNQHVVSHGHRWIELVRKLNSKITIKKVSKDYQHLTYSFMVVDDKALLFRQDARDYLGVLNYNHPVEAQSKKRKFIEIWERADADPELTRLHI